MLQTSRSTGFLLGMFLFGLGFQPGFTQTYNRSFCTGITMPETRLCDDSLPIIEIVEVYQYDGVNSNPPCVYRAGDCGRAINHGTQLYKVVVTHCDGQRTCGGFYITSLLVCSRRAGDYMVISFRCRRDETLVSPTSIMASSPTTPAATIPPYTTPTSATTGQPVNPPTRSGVTGAESSETKTDRCTSGDPRRDNVGVGVGVATVVVFNRRKRGQTPDKTNVRVGGGTQTGRAIDEVAYYNVTPTVVPGEAAYSNVDITRATGSKDYCDVDTIMEPERNTSVPNASLQHTAHTNLARVGAGNGTHSNLEQNTPGLQANVPDTDGQYADLTGEGPGLSDYEALGPELVVHSSEYVALTNKQ